MTSNVSEKRRATGAAQSRDTRGGGKWVTAFILVLIAAFFFGSVIVTRMAVT